MSDRRWLRHGVRIGTTEYRRTLRGLRQDSLRLFLVGGAVLAVLAVTAFLVLLMRLFLADLEPTPLPAMLAGLTVPFWGTIVYLYAARALSRTGRIDAESLMLTTTSTRAVVTGLVIAELLRGATYLALPTIILAGAFAATVGAPLSVLSIPLAVTALLASAGIVGYTLGLAGATLVSTSPFIARYKTPLGIGLAVLLMGPIFALSSGRIDFAVLASVPIAWYTDLLVVGSPIQPSLLRALGAIGVTIALVGLAGAAVDRLAGIYWYSDPITGTITGVESTSPPEAVSPLEAALRPIPLSLVLSKTPSRTVAARALIQTLRNPGKLSFVLLPVIVAAPTIVNAFGSGIGWEILLAVCFVGIPWFSGVAFGLNPLGDEGDVLPVTLTTTVSGRTFVRGLAILGFSVGSMLLLLTGLVFGLFSPFNTTDLTAALLLAAALLWCSVLLAPAAGVRFPRFSTVSAGRTQNILPPSLTASTLHGIIVFGFGLFGALSWFLPEGTRSIIAGFFSTVLSLLLVWVAERGVGLVEPVLTTVRTIGSGVGNLAPGVIQLGGYGGAIGGLVLLGVTSYWYVISRFESYQIS
jgi:hypothetical protein